MNNDKNKDIKKMMEEASTSSDNDEYLHEKSNGKGVIMFVVFFLIMVTALFLGKQTLKPQEFVDKTEEPDMNDGRNEVVTSDDVSSIVWGFKKPVEIPEWTSKPFSKDMLEDEDFTNQVLSYAESFQGISSAFGYKPSEEFGYTSNPVEEEIMNEDLEITLPNEMYSRATKEDYYKAFSIYTQMLINPVFGDWVFADDSGYVYNNSPFDKFSEIFTNEWWEKNIVEEGNYNNLPILYDWENDGFGGLIEDKSKSLDYNLRSSFYGEIYENYTEDGDIISSEVIETSSTGEDEIISVNIPITYKALNGDSESIEKNAYMYIELKINEDVLKENNRVLISNIEVEYK